MAVPLEYTDATTPDFPTSPRRPTYPREEEGVQDDGQDEEDGQEGGFQDNNNEATDSSVVLFLSSLLRPTLMLPM